MKRAFSRLWVGGLFCWVVLALAVSAPGTTFYVSPTGANIPPYETWLTSATNIQDALNLATDGDAVMVSNGTYRIGPTVMVTNGIHLQSVNGWSNTVVKASGGQCMRILHGNAVVEGFSIQGGSINEGNGAGVSMSGGTLRACEIRDNQGLGKVTCWKWYMCSMSHGDGAGVYAGGASLVEDCIIRENRACVAGGIMCVDDAVVRNCLIYGNLATGYGVQTYGPQGQPSTYFSASGDGAGVHANGRARIENCTIARNYGRDVGGGVYCIGESSILNSIVAMNGAANGRNLYLGSTSVVVRYTCVTPAVAGTGNTTLSPRFRAVHADDYRLTSRSPCLDTGSDADAPAMDINGVARPQDGDQDGFGQVDMGAYESLPGSLPPPPIPCDYDGDSKADLAVYHGASGNWYIQQSSDKSTMIANWGWSGTQPVAEDYDGDERMDLGAFHNASGDWYILRSSDKEVYQRNWGWNKTEPFPSDFDMDGRADLTVFHQAAGDWYILQSAINDSPLKTNWGWSATSACPGDFDGNGGTDFAVFHKATGDWYVWFPSGGAIMKTNWGWSATSPVPADYDGDGIDDLAVFARTLGNWYIIQSSDAQIRIQNWGWSGTTPVAADYDGDGLADLAVFDQPTGNWYILQSTDDQMRMENWGWNETIPAFFQRGK
ncbi:MAG TPA: choice-of-anchor Q domain-containing protein [Kiritimatiellia bacterium]|nr:choice-of-anchor Q domain-containing protein [Kiritimatiellia bacterium]